MTSQPNDQQQPNRRAFMQQGTAATAALAAAGLPGVHTSADEKPAKSANDLVTLALVGTGGRGGGAANDSLSINENIKLVAMADLYPEKCNALRRGLQKYGEKVAVEDAKIYRGLDAYKRILDDDSIDVVMFTTSPGFRPYHISEAVDAGKHVFAEKPTCVDPAGYQVCVKAHEKAVANKTAIVTGTQYRRQVNYVGAINKLREGAIGDIISATTRYCSTGIWYRPRRPEMSDAEYQLYNWMHFIWLSGDQIAEQAVHNIDLMNWVMDSPPEEAYGSGGRFTRPEDSEMWDNVSIDYKYPGNKVVSFMCRQIPNTQGENGNVIYGRDAIMKIAAGTGTSKIEDYSGKEVWSMSGSIGDAYRQEHKDLIDSIRAGKPIVELQQTADSSLTAVMGRIAAYTGQRITWDFLTKEPRDSFEKKVGLHYDLFPKNLSMDGTLEFPGHAIPGKLRKA